MNSENVMPSVEEYKQEITNMLSEFDEKDAKIIRVIYTIMLRHLEKRWV